MNGVTIYQPDEFIYVLKSSQRGGLFPCQCDNLGQKYRLLLPNYIVIIVEKYTLGNNIF